MSLNINDYKIDGFQKVCDVKLQNNAAHWKYENINTSVMFADHRSWVYFIVENDEIIKVGESGNPLGIRKKNDYPWVCDDYKHEPQPLTGSKCRFGRYINGDGTDASIRYELRESIQKNNISLWALKCDYVEVPFTMCGSPAGTLISTVHKDLEKRYLDFIEDTVGAKPRLNKGRA